MYGNCLHFTKSENEYLNSLDQPENDRKYAKLVFEKCSLEMHIVDECDTKNAIKKIESKPEYFVAKGKFGAERDLYLYIQLIIID